MTAETKTKAGIIIPDTAQEKPMQGEVVAVGKGKRLEDGRLQELGVKVGDKVIYGKWSGTEVKLDGVEHVILKEEDLFGIRRLIAMLRPGDSQRVAELMRETAAAELLPRFRDLAEEEIRQKRPGDFVTVADVASEQRLAAGLAKILPGVPVVGEEAAEKEPGLVDLIGRPGEACWVVDPLDGTANFAAGKDRFAMIVCLVRDTWPSAAGSSTCRRDGWRWRCKGQGVTLDGTAVRARRPAGTPVGFVGYKIRKEFDRQLPPARASPLGAAVDPELRRRRISGDPVPAGPTSASIADQALGPCRRHA